MIRSISSPMRPVEIRGEFRRIATDVPGIDLCEHLPRLARRARRFALVRTMSHAENNHFPATHKNLTGHVMPRQLPGDAVNAASNHDWPSYGSAYDALQPRNDGIPNSVSLPYFWRAGQRPGLGSTAATSPQGTTHGKSIRIRIRKRSQLITNRSMNL